VSLGARVLRAASKYLPGVTMPILSPKAAATGAVASVAIGVCTIALFAMVLNGADHGLPQESTVAVTTSLLQEDASSNNFNDLMEEINHFEDGGSDSARTSDDVNLIGTTQGNKPNAKPKAPKSPASARLSESVAALDKIAKDAAGELNGYTSAATPTEVKEMADAKAELKDADEERDDFKAHQVAVHLKKMSDMEGKIREKVDETPIPAPNTKAAAKLVKSAAASYASEVAHVSKEIKSPAEKAAEKKAAAAKAAATAAAAKAKAQSAAKAAAAAAKQEKNAAVKKVMNGVFSMPPLPQAPDCSAESKARCKLLLWKALDACTSETLAPSEAYKSPACKKARVNQTKACMEALSGCDKSTAKAVEKRLSAQILPKPAGDDDEDDDEHVEKKAAHKAVKNAVKKAAKKTAKKAAKKVNKGAPKASLKDIAKHAAKKLSKVSTSKAIKKISKSVQDNIANAIANAGGKKSKYKHVQDHAAQKQPDLEKEASEEQHAVVQKAKKEAKEGVKKDDRPDLEKEASEEQHAVVQKAKKEAKEGVKKDDRPDLEKEASEEQHAVVQKAKKEAKQDVQKAAKTTVLPEIDQNIQEVMAHDIDRAESELHRWRNKPAQSAQPPEESPVEAAQRFDGVPEAEFKMPVDDDGSEELEDPEELIQVANVFPDEDDMSDMVEEYLDVVARTE